MSSPAPWLERRSWSGGVVASRDKADLGALWFFAGVWNVLTLGMLVAWLRGGMNDLPAFLGGLLVASAVSGIALVGQALIQTARENRFRDARLRLDPFPGSIGGQVGGSVDVEVRFGSEVDARATLHCIHSYMSGSGEDRRRREDVVWSSEVVPELEGSAGGTRLWFVFDVPEMDVPESGNESATGDYHYWSIHLSAQVPGADLDRTFVVPVFRVEPPLEASHPFHTAALDARELATRGVRVERSVRGLTLRYAPGRYGGTPLGLVLFGALCVGSGTFIFTLIGGDLGILGFLFGGTFLTVFGLTGVFLFLSGLQMLVNGLTVELGGQAIRSTRRYLFLTTTREARLSDLTRIQAKVSMQTGQGRRANTVYAIEGRLQNGKRIPLGDGIRGAYLLDRIRSLIEAETGLSVEVALRRSKRLRLDS
ncbi:MAG: hypothetical protein OEN56_07005 [Gemmatimonadota bacterium]|nr:hypothetical protein [Gemmatimonadota bacterium]